MLGGKNIVQGSLNKNYRFLALKQYLSQQNTANCGIHCVLFKVSIMCGNVSFFNGSHIPGKQNSLFQRVATRDSHQVTVKLYRTVTYCVSDVAVIIVHPMNFISIMSYCVIKISGSWKIYSDSKYTVRIRHILNIVFRLPFN